MADLKSERISEKLTWEEIVEQYPNQWVGLVDVEYKTSHPTCPNVKLARVKYSDLTADELVEKQLIEREDIYSINTGLGFNNKAEVLFFG